MNHPNALQLEAFACGERAPGVEQHARECNLCRAFLERVQRLSAAPPMALPQLLESAASKATAPSRWTRPLAVSAVVPLAAAAALLLVHPWGKPNEGTDSSRLLPPASSPLPTTPDPDTTFKGAIQVSVIRERGGSQERFAGDVRVRPGDRLRVEVALDRPQAVEGVIVGDDGSSLELMPAEVRSAGTHFSEKSARVDAQPLHGTLLVGPPEAVGRARGGEASADVAKLRVEWEPLP